jgi:glucose-6-phosphate 1-dehydrogenase
MQSRQLEQPLEIVGVARVDWDTDQYRSRAVDAIAESAPEIEASIRDQLVQHLHYVQADATDPEAMSPAIGDEPSLIYLALPPMIYPDCLKALDEIGLPEGSRIIIEKPFGHDHLDSAIELNKLLKQRFTEDMIYRIDHFTACSRSRRFRRSASPTAFSSPSGIGSTSSR